MDRARIMCNPKEHANIDSKVQMGPARADGCRRLDEETWEQYYDVTTAAG